MKLIYKGRHLKTIPKEFSELPDLEFYVEDEFSKRLDHAERKAMIRALFEFRTRKFVLKQRQNPLLDEYLGSAKLVDAVKVKTTHESYYALRFEGNKLLKCPFDIFAASPHHSLVQKA